MNLLFPSLPPSPPSNLPVTHSLSLPRSQPLITVIGGFGEIRQRDRRKGGEKERLRDRERGRWRSEAQPFSTLLLLCVFLFSNHLSFYHSFSKSRGMHLLWLFFKDAGLHQSWLHSQTKYQVSQTLSFSFSYSFVQPQLLRFVIVFACWLCPWCGLRSVRACVWLCVRLCVCERG